MKKMILLLIIMAFSLTLLFADDAMANGGFENWTGGTPDDWTTIDSGINVTQETTTIHGGLSSANVDVTTGTQSNTDLRQSVAVTNGTEYSVSVWVYHTEGHEKARFYVDGYRSYSDNTITGAWQELTYTYTASADGNVEVGLRFYDQSGFDGDEIVYVDDFTMTYTPSASPTITLNPTSLSGFNYSEGNGPSAEQTFTAEGTNLTNDITLAASTNYEISETSGSGYTSPITLTQSGGTVSTTTIYVRLKAGLSAGDYNGETIDATSSGATSKSVTCSGSVDAPVTTTLPYSETFDADLGDCYTYSVSGATKEWYWNSGAYAEMNGYNSGDTEEDWLILPGINLDNYTDEIMTFDSWYKYGTDDANNYFKLYYSTDYSGVGDPSSSTWTELSYTQPSAADTWTGSGDIDLSAISGTSVWIGFKYHYNSGSYRAWGIDDISIAEVHNAPPAINNIVQTPASNIGTSTTVSVSADVTDSDGTISSVELHWGVASGNLGTTISMSNTSGDTYTTDSDIPVQSEGTTVYYEVYALDNGGASTTSDEASYFVTDAVEPGVGDLVITEICGDGVDGVNDDDGFAEIWNATSHTLNLGNMQARYYNSNPGAPTQTVDLTGTIAAGAYIVVSQNATNFQSQYGFAPEFTGSNFYFNGGDDGFDIYNTATKAGVIDSFNDNGTGASPWTWSDSDPLERNTTNDGATQTNWTDNTTGTGTPDAANDTPLPVVLSSFYAEFAANELAIVWTTQSESNLNGWNVYKSNSNDFDSAITVNSKLITAEGTSTQSHTYRYIDQTDAVSGQTYYYWLEAIDNNGISTLTNPISYTIPENDNPDSPDLNAKYGLSQNYPNPFNPTTEIKFRLANNGNAKLEIYNIKGQIVETLFDGFANADQEITKVWNADNITSGVYFYKLTAGGKTYTRKMILMK